MKRLSHLDTVFGTHIRYISQSFCINFVIVLKRVILFSVNNIRLTYVYVFDLFCKGFFRVGFSVDS